MLRRTFLASAVAGLSLTPVGRGFAASLPDTASPRLVVVLLRGAIDGLNVVVPYSDQQYYDARPTIAIARPGAGDGAIDLDGRFGLHPALAALQPFWAERSLAFIHAAGSPDPTRSHFDAQDFMETGTPGNKLTADGWMNRLLGVLARQGNATGAVAFGATLPLSLAGAMPVATVPVGHGAEHVMPVDAPAIDAAFDKLYIGDDRLSRAYRDGRAARARMLTALDKDMAEAAKGAPTPVGFSIDTAHLAQLAAADRGLCLAFFDLSGWDTHVGEGAHQGQLASHLHPLADGLATLARSLGPDYARTVIVVLSEFGRTLHENDNGGTDHGHGNAIWVMGGPVKGGRVLGDWPGLGPSALHDGRDLAVTTDFRSVLATLLVRHLRLDPRTIATVLPGAPPAQGAVADVV